MLSFSLRASLIALVASATAAAAAPSLTLKSSPSHLKVDGVTNLKVTTTVTNVGDETLKLLRDPRGILNPFPENTFSITGATGSHPLFKGAVVKYSPKYAAGLDDPDASTVLAPGDFIDVTHDLSAAYDFTQSGAGDYTIEPSNRFTYVDSNGKPKDFHAHVEGITQVTLYGNLVVSRVRDRRAAFAGCASDKKLEIAEAANGAQTYTNNALTYLKGISSSTDQYTTWFGTYTDLRKGIVQSHFRLMALRKFATFTYDCSCNEAGVFAYVYPTMFGKVYLCPAFWEAPGTGVDSKAGTLVHEASHFIVNGGTQDHKYGQKASKELAISNPEWAILNADSHEYFAETLGSSLADDEQTGQVLLA